MFAGFVGPSFLSAYVSGNIFASPTAAQVFEAIRLCRPSSSSSRGTFVVCGNYTGDILNTGLAITRAQTAGYKVRFVPVGDNVAIGREKGGKVGWRGLSGHLIALKCACALADMGEGLERATEMMEYEAGEIGTMGWAFDRGTLPMGTLSPLPVLPPDTIEPRMGAHGEQGPQALPPPPSPATLVERMITLLTDISDTDHAFIPFSQSSCSSTDKLDNEIVLLLGSLGLTSDAILARFAELAVAEMEKREFVVRRLIMGPMVTSLKMSGVGITVWTLPSEEGEEWGRRRRLGCGIGWCSVWRGGIDG